MTIDQNDELLNASPIKKSPPQISSQKKLKEILIKNIKIEDQGKNARNTPAYDEIYFKTVDQAQNEVHGNEQNNMQQNDSRKFST